jgi:hypothetical protein
MNAIRGVRTSAPAVGQATISAEQLTEYEALKKMKEQLQAGQAEMEVGGEQMVISAQEYSAFAELRKKEDGGDEGRLRRVGRASVACRPRCSAATK